MSEYIPESWEADESQLWEYVSGDREGDYGFLSDDRTAIALFNEGWIADTDYDRTAIRDAFLDYAIEQGYFDDRSDFDWDAWREYMGYDD